MIFELEVIGKILDAAIAEQDWKMVVALRKTIKETCEDSMPREVRGA